MHVGIIQECINLVQLDAYGQNVGHVVRENGEVKDAGKESIKVCCWRKELCYV